MHPDFTGIWKADLTKSRLLGPSPAAIQVKIDHRDPVLFAEMLITAANGGQHRIEFAGRTTGEPADNLVLGAAWRSQLAWAGSELLIKSQVSQNNRKFHFRDFWSLSSDGETLTMTHRDDDLAGQVTVLYKVRAT